MTEDNRKPKKKIWRSALAVLLALTLVASPIVTLKTQIRFSKLKYVEDTAAYAAQVTEDETGYLTDKRLTRAWKYLQTVVGTPKTYHDYEMYASIAIAREDFETAEKYLKGCIETADEENADPSNLYLRLGSLCILQDKNEAALKALSRSIELNAGQTSAYYLRAQLETEAGDTQAAIDDYRSYVMQPNAAPSITSQLGALFETMGEFETAVKCYSAGIDAKVDNLAEMYVGRAKCHGLQGNTTAAKSDLEAYFSLTDEDPDGQASALLGMCLMETGDYAGAEDYFHKAIQNGYEDELLILSQSVKCAFAAGDYEAAEADGEKALELIKNGSAVAEDEDGAVTDEAELHYWTGMSYLAQNDYKKALSHFTDTKADQPDYSDIEYYRGVCLLADEDYESAAEAFTSSIERGEAVTVSCYNRAVCNVRMERLDEARSDLEEVVARGDDSDLAEQAQELLEVFDEESPV